MNWDKLKEFKCPKCSAYLNDGVVFSCSICRFSIIVGKFRGIVGAYNSLEIQADILLKNKKKRK